MKREASPARLWVKRESSPRRIAALPRISRGLLRIFGKYSEHYLRRHFHSVRLLANGIPKSCSGLPLVIYLNHSAWWDPLVCLLLAGRFFPQRLSYAPIDASALRRYRFLGRLGFFGVTQRTRRGAADFCAMAEGILGSNDSALWLTPQGKFTDAHARPLRFQSGISHLSRRLPRSAFVPLAIEYTFWEERLPEILISFGEPVVFDTPRILSVPQATHLFEAALGSVQDQLAAASQRRRTEEWRTLIEGSAGVSRVYDLWRRSRAAFRGEKFKPSHSTL